MHDVHKRFKTAQPNSPNKKTKCMRNFIIKKQNANSEIFNKDLSNNKLHKYYLLDKGCNE